MARVMARRWAVVLMLAPAQLRRGRPLPRDLRLRPSLQGGPGRGRADDGVWSVTVACSGEIWSRRRLVACGGCYWLVVAVGAARVAVIAFGIPDTLALSSGSRKKPNKPQLLNFAAV